jgi:hypothetical protein
LVLITLIKVQTTFAAVSMMVGMWARPDVRGVHGRFGRTTIVLIHLRIMRYMATARPDIVQDAFRFMTVSLLCENVVVKKVCDWTIRGLVVVVLSFWVESSARLVLIA